MSSNGSVSAYRPHSVTMDRLVVWRRLASMWVPVDEIAARLGVTRATLDRMVCRARKRGHPDAILHPLGASYGNGVGHLYDGAARARRRARQGAEAHRGGQGER